MPRPRVLSFGFFGDKPKSPDLGPSPISSPPSDQQPFGGHRRKLTLDTAVQPRNASVTNLDQISRESPPPSTALQERNRADSRASRPVSMIQTLSPAVMDTGDTLPELQPVFSFLNNHANKLYQEGYFLKLHDLDSRGRPSADRNWTECFAQLVGTVLSLWDAAALDAAGAEGEVLPTFINLSDASIKMIESLPMNGTSGGTLQNVLSISTAANNRYLLHFNSLNSLTQWTAGIRLAMYEHAALQESYTGSLIAGKGKLLNNIKPIMERARFKNEDWARVRFGAGTPWRRCWCVISPPDEKEYAKAQKALKKKSSYDRKTIVPKGDVKFYDTRRITKKTVPIATISDAFAAYAIYPQSKPLIDQSTLVKLEGLITIHSSPESTTEGFIFVMPEVHAAVTGFEMMLRWLFPVWDTFALYGRPTRLIADTLDQRGLMFAMPRDRRYGYLDTLDVSGLIHTEGSQAWSERQWRSELKKLVSHRMNTADADTNSPLRNRRNTISRTSLPGMVSRTGGVRFDDQDLSVSSPVSRKASPAPPYNDRTNGSIPPSPNGVNSHRRSASDMLHRRFQADTPSRLSIDTSSPTQDGPPPPPPSHGVPLHVRRGPNNVEHLSPDDMVPSQGLDELNLKAAKLPVTPVATPPAFMHPPSAKPPAQPYQAPELRRATSGMDAATLHQMQEAKQRDEDYGEYPSQHNRRPHHEVSIDAKPLSSLKADVLTRTELVSASSTHEQLPTIPGSPVVNEVVPGSLKAEPEKTLPPPPSPVRSLGATARLETSPQRKPVSPNRLSPARRTSSTYSIPRKPVSPSRSVTPHQLPSPTSVNPPDEMPGHIIDNSALEQILQRDISVPVGSEIPDYYTMASSKPASPRKPEEPARTGRLRTVGNSDYRADGPDASANKTPNTLGSPIAVPVVDFGPTYSHGASLGNEDKKLPRQPPQAGLSPYSPGNGNERHSYFGGRNTPSPAPIDSAGPYQSRHKGRISQDMSDLKDSTARRSLTPEQWVAYRASIASQPLAFRSSPNLAVDPNTSHKRPESNKRHSTQGITPPISRHTSGDWSQQAQKTPPQSISRPDSRNALRSPRMAPPKTLLDSPHNRSLSAKEQMHVARATGMPMVDLDQTEPRRQRQQDPNAGLYAALQSRERERATVKEGYRSNAIQQAITVHQQQQQQQAQMQVEMQRQAHYQAAQQHHALQAAQMAQYQAQQNAYAQSIGAQQAMNYERANPSVYNAQVGHGRPGQQQQQYYEPYQARERAWAPMADERRSNEPAGNGTR